VSDNLSNVQKEAKRIYTDFGTSLDRRDWMKAIEAVHQEVKAYDGPVHVVHDFRNIEYRMMTTSLKHAVQVAMNIPDNVATYTVVTNNSLVEFVGRMVYRMVPKSNKKIYFAPSMEVVEEIIANNQSNEA